MRITRRRFVSMLGLLVAGVIGVTRASSAETLQDAAAKIGVRVDRDGYLLPYALRDGLVYGVATIQMDHCRYERLNIPVYWTDGGIVQ